MIKKLESDMLIEQTSHGFSMDWSLGYNCTSGGGNSCYSVCMGWAVANAYILYSMFCAESTAQKRGESFKVLTYINFVKTPSTS